MCHINFPELVVNIDNVLAQMHANDVVSALCVSVNLADFPQVLALAEQHQHIYASVGVHPDYEGVEEPDVASLVKFARHPKVIAIGETGLDYFRLKGDLEWQRLRFRTHIRAARESDTLCIMEEEKASEVRGVMHCFTETWEVAEAALAMGFYISFSGIVTFKNAKQLKEVAQRVPMERILIETDSPYLAPVPHRGKLNQPAYVKHVAEEIALLRGISIDEVGRCTTENFTQLFNQEMIVQ